MQTLISWSQVLSNKFLPKSKIIWRLNSLALNVQCKTFQFFKAGKIVYKFTNLLRKKLALFDILVVWLQKQEPE